MTEEKAARDPRPNRIMQEQWREAMDKDWFGAEYDIWLSGWNRAIASLSQKAELPGLSIAGKCQRIEREAGRGYPRTCPVCGLSGKCHYESTTPKAAPNQVTHGEAAAPLQLHNLEGNEPWTRKPK